MDLIDKLSHKDIIFLRAVRDINANPEEYEDTSRGEMPANTASISRATELTDRQVGYRISERGLDKENMGLILAYGPSFDEGKVQPKSAELTQTGVETLTEIEESWGSGGSGGDSNEAVKQLRARVEALEEQGIGEGEVASAGSELSDITNQIDQLESQLDSIENDLATLQDVVGASDWDELADDLRRIRKLSPAMMYSLQEVLAIDVLELIDTPNPNPETKEEMRTGVLNALQTAGSDKQSN